MAEYPDNFSDPTFPASLRAMVCRFHGRDLTIKAHRYNLRDTPEELLASRAMRLNPNARVSQKVADMPKATSLNDSAIYVMEPESGTAAKIGVSANPLCRLAQLQTASYEQLKIRALFWMPEKQAFGIEGVTLRVIAKMGRRLTGEWCDLSSADLSATVACVIKSNEAVQVSDSEMQLQNIETLYSHDADLQESMAFRAGATPESLLLRKIG